MFLVGIIIWAGVIDFIIQIPFSSILNTEDYMPASMNKWVGALIGIVAICISVFIACKRFVIPASLIRLACWVGIIYFVFGLLSFVVVPLELGSTNIFAFVSVQAIISTIITAVVVGGTTYLALRLFSRNNSLPASQV